MSSAAVVIGAVRVKRIKLFFQAVDSLPRKNVIFHSYLPSIILVLFIRFCELPYFFCFFTFQNNPKNLDQPYLMDLDLWDFLGRVKLILQQNFIGLI